MIPDPETLTFDEHGLLPVVVQDVGSGAVLMVAWADRAAVERTAETGFACFYSRSRGRAWMKGESSGNRMRVVEARADCDRDTLLLRVRPEGPACHTGARTCFEENSAGPARTSHQGSKRDAVAARRSEARDRRAPQAYSTVRREARPSATKEMRVDPAAQPNSDEKSGLELGWLARVIAGRRGADPEESYTARLLAAGPERIGRKLGEEAMETVLAAVLPPDPADESGDGKDSLAWEAADLLYHLLVLLESRGVDVAEVAAELARRHSAKEPAE
jgi:phosphoribosyl-AMP cyclohydrolase / phosphoribosyl-ATP pyrophosphohydrolase